jgi:hypothetical protein
LKPEWWGSPLAQEEKYQGRKKTCDKKIIIIMLRLEASYHRRLTFSYSPPRQPEMSLNTHYVSVVE